LQLVGVDEAVIVVEEFHVGAYAMGRAESPGNVIGSADAVPRRVLTVDAPLAVALGDGLVHDVPAEDGAVEVGEYGAHIGFGAAVECGRVEVVAVLVFEKCGGRVVPYQGVSPHFHAVFAGKVDDAVGSGPAIGGTVVARPQGIHLHGILGGEGVDLSFQQFALRALQLAGFDGGTYVELAVGGAGE